MYPRLYRSAITKRNESSCIYSLTMAASNMNEQDIKERVKTFILNEYLPGEDPAALTDTTPLMTTGILDSIAVLKS